MTLDDLLTVEDGIKFYIEHLEECKEESKSLKSFFRKYNSETKGFHSGNKKLSRHHSNFTRLKGKKKLPERVIEFGEWIGLQIPENLRQKLKRLTEKHLKEYSLEQGVELYIRHLEECKEKSKSIKRFFAKYNVENNGFLQEHDNGGKLSRYLYNFLRLRRNGRLPERVTFEEWIGLQISEGLKQKLEELTEKYSSKREVKKYSLEQGVELYIRHLEECKEKSKPIKSFFAKYDAENNSFFSKNISGNLNKYYSKFLKLRKKGKLPEKVTEFEEWISPQIPEELNRKLEELTEKHLKKYSLEEGVEFYIQHLEEHKEKSKFIKSFFMKYDTKNNGFLPRKKWGNLNKYLDEFNRLRRKDKIPKRVVTFKDWLKSQIPENLKQKLEKLTKKYLREYSLEQGAEFYIQHLEEYKEKSKPIRRFFVKYDIENNTFHSGNRTGHLSKYYNGFRRLRGEEKLSKKITAFEDYLIQHLPEEKRKRAEYYLKGQFLKDVAKREIDREQLRIAVLGGN